MNNPYAVRVATDGTTDTIGDYRRWAIPPRASTDRLGPLLVHTNPQECDLTINHFARHVWKEIAGSGTPPMLRGPVWFTPHPHAGAPLTRAPGSLVYAIQDIVRSAPKLRRRRWDLSVASGPGRFPAGSDGHGVACDAESGRRAVALCDAGDGGLGRDYARRHAAALAARASQTGDPIDAIRQQLCAVKAEPYSWPGSLGSAIVATWKADENVLQLAWSGCIEAYRLVDSGQVLTLTSEPDHVPSMMGLVAYREVSMRSTVRLALATDGVGLQMSQNTYAVSEVLGHAEDPKCAAGLLARARPYPGSYDEGTVLVVDVHRPRPEVF
ncbi:hypothetical protein [Kitasatospora sp. NPDC058478]|uniref:hypothetical protein n=1 Tax=unclassified Kitasatospora TaxID=2633591 RepID=UPI0036605F90